MTTNTERTQDLAAANRAIATVDSALGGLKSLVADRSMRYANASKAGAALAYEVRRFLADPEGVGTDALAAAEVVFGSLHAGNFCDIAVPS